MGGGRDPGWSRRRSGLRSDRLGSQCPPQGRAGWSPWRTGGRQPRGVAGGRHQPSDPARGAVEEGRPERGCSAGHHVRSRRPATPGSVVLASLAGVVRPEAAALYLVPMPRKPARTHHVYVIELAPEAWKHIKFRRANPNRDSEKPLLYVGMTGLTPEIRFERHKYGVWDNTYARKYGVKLRPDLYEGVNPMS